MIWCGFMPCEMFRPLMLRRAMKATAKQRTAKGLGKYVEPQMLPFCKSKILYDAILHNAKKNIAHRARYSD